MPLRFWAAAFGFAFLAMAVLLLCHESIDSSLDYQLVGILVQGHNLMPCSVFQNVVNAVACVL